MKFIKSVFTAPLKFLHKSTVYFFMILATPMIILASRRVLQYFTIEEVREAFEQFEKEAKKRKAAKQ